jgi:D-sedoheptulose 7-phosphate isomerase
MNDFLTKYRSDLARTVEALPLDRVQKVIEVFEEARDHGRRIFTCGNGGSAATASHFVCDIVKGASYGRDTRFKILCLSDNQATLTAYSNDVSYDVALMEPLKNFAEPGDVLLAISGSGNSPNVIHAVEWANAAGLTTIGLTGRDGGKLGKAAQIEVNVSNPHMGRIEDAHMAVCHMVAYYFMEHGAGGGCGY